MLWPGLLGKDKYEFAKTYCAVNFFRGSQGKIIQDFSRGVRLEELNVLLKQTVMIRRLKKHVLVELPPKRRQVISLQLKKSHIISAMSAVRGDKEHEDLKDDFEEEPSEISDEPDDSGSCPRSTRMLSEQEVGVAKLSGFFEWLSMHPIFADTCDADNLTLSLSCPKMIIFAHHHKVLDGVQAFICDKGIGFVRIDGTTLPRDRQSAVNSFQSSKEIKVAIIGITAACVGLDFSLANHVVFLELPRDPSHMCQAEDRAHRRGQTKAVNIYIFCAKNTSDESRWRYLNKSLHRVTSTTDGKYEAIRGIEVDIVSHLGACEEKAGSSKYPVLEKASVSDASGVELMQFPNIKPKQDLQPSEKYDDAAETKTMRMEDQNVIAGDICEDEISHDEADLIADLNVWKERDSGGLFAANASDAENVTPDIMSSRGSEEVGKDEYQTRNMQEDIVMTQKLLEVIGADSSIQIQVQCLRFEVSRYTGRIHLYACIPEIDLRPKPLFENFRPEECESPEETSSNNRSDWKSIKDNPAYRPSLLAFIDEWNNLKPIQRNSLLGKPLQLPLSIELCYLKESLNHDSGGLLNGRSKRRITPLNEISHQLPSNAVWKKVRLLGGSRKKEREYAQGWTVTGVPLCKLCQNPCLSKNAEAPEFLEDLFCNLSCYEEYRLRTSNRYLRQELFEIEHGVCTNCQLDCHKLVQIIRPLSLLQRQKHVESIAPKLAGRKKLLDKLINDPVEGNAWHADHIVAVYQGGGECRLQNMRTLCVACHADVTAAQRVHQRSMRIKAKEQLKLGLNTIVNVQAAEQNDSTSKDQSLPDEELLVNIPGSAYSYPKDEVNE